MSSEVITWCTKERYYKLNLKESCAAEVCRLQLQVKLHYTVEDYLEYRATLRNSLVRYIFVIFLQPSVLYTGLLNVLFSY